MQATKMNRPRVRARERREKKGKRERKEGEEGRAREVERQPGAPAQRKKEESPDGWMDGQIDTHTHTHTSKKERENRKAKMDG